MFSRAITDAAGCSRCYLLRGKALTRLHIGTGKPTTTSKQPVKRGSKRLAKRFAPCKKSKKSEHDRKDGPADATRAHL